MVLTCFFVRFSLGALLVLSLISCGSSSDDGSEPSATAIPQATATPTSLPDPVETVFPVAAVSASDYEAPDHIPDNAIDGLTEDDSRWSAQGTSDVWLQLDMGQPVLFNTLDIFFLNNSERNTCFTVATSDDGENWTTRRADIVSNGERLFAIDETYARYIRYYGHGNSVNAWNSIIEIAVQWMPLTGDEDLSDGVAGTCGGDISGGSDVIVGDLISGTGATFTLGNLDPDLSPSANFDLSVWKITYPDATEANPPEVLANAFYTDPDTGAMVFECVNQGEQTSSSTKYSRSELREMINRSAGTKALGNNWVISTASDTNQQAAGGVDGHMKATVAVDHVSTSATDDYMLGRVIVGQIHASTNEPFKVYYRKFPEHTKGSVYFSYEDSKTEVYFDMFGQKSSAEEPADGIALREQWAYEVDVTGRDMVITITKADGTYKSQTVTWGSEYDSDWFYFKAGNYNQNNGGDIGDYAQVSIFALDVSHD